MVLFKSLAETHIGNLEIGSIAVKAAIRGPVGLSRRILRIPCSIAAALHGVSAACYEGMPGMAVPVYIFI